jgi:uncharacterized membrane protein YhiD involved in acid resistance
MPEFLFAFVPDRAAAPLTSLIRLLGAWLLGWVVAGIYRRTRPQGAVLESFPGTLILLSVLIAMVTQVIGDNIARAFSLVGALSIVRFRTVVRDTQDTAYVIFAVAVGMAVGAQHASVALAGIAVVALAAFVMRNRSVEGAAQGTPSFEVAVRMALGADARERLRSVLDRHLRDCRLVGVSTGRQGLALDVSYSGQLTAEDGAELLVREVNRIEGVQDVRLTRIDVRPD